MLLGASLLEGAVRLGWLTLGGVSGGMMGMWRLRKRISEGDARTREEIGKEIGDLKGEIARLKSPDSSTSPRVLRDTSVIIQDGTETAGYANCQVIFPRPEEGAPSMVIRVGPRLT